MPKVCLKVWKVFGRDEGGRERVKGCMYVWYVCTYMYGMQIDLCM